MQEGEAVMDVEELFVGLIGIAIPVLLVVLIVWLVVSGL